MKERIALNPMQQSYLRGREAKCGMFSKACFVYEYDPAKVAHDRLVEALQRLPQLHPLLGAGLDGETLVLGAGRLEIQESPLWADGIEAQAETLFQQFTWSEQCLTQVTLVTGCHAYVVALHQRHPGRRPEPRPHPGDLGAVLRRGTLGTGGVLPGVSGLHGDPARMNSTRQSRQQALEETMGQFPPAAELAIAEEFYTPEPLETGIRRQPIAGIPVAGVPAEGSRAGGHRLSRPADPGGQGHRAVHRPVETWS